MKNSRVKKDSQGHKYVRNILKVDLIDLHIHLGGAMSPHTLWEIAHSQGIKLPVKDYWEFLSFLKNVYSIKDYFRVYEWTERIQSSPKAIEQGIYNVISKEYRSSNVNKIELRFNPMFRTRGNEIDMDQIIHAAIRGMERAMLDYDMEAGLIFCLDRRLSFELNKIIIEKAIKYAKRGVVGVDIAGPEEFKFVQGKDFSEYKKLFKENVGVQITELKYLNFEDQEFLEKYKKLFNKARKKGLGITVHTGEMKGSGGSNLIKVVNAIKPDRIGHGIKAAFNQEALNLLVENDIVLEICPTSNITNGTVKDWGEMKKILHSFIKNKVKFTINTDAPYLVQTGMAGEMKKLWEKKVLDKKQLLACLETAKQASFIE
ncbi:MAG: adenosine deaminase [Candidatus Moranbacteria bacterium]|nr:adenosine deaminase [Candidatus Moranbacteria bacterium]